jgi:hypothetical protein
MAHRRLAPSGPDWQPPRTAGTGPADAYEPTADVIEAPSGERALQHPATAVPAHNMHDRSARRAARPRFRPCYGLTTICRRGNRRQADLNTGPYRTVLRCGLSRRLTRSPRGWTSGSRSSIAPGAAWPGSSDFRLPFVFVEG